MDVQNLTLKISTFSCIVLIPLLLGLITPSQANNKTKFNKPMNIGLEAKNESGVKGSIKLTQNQDQLKITGEISGLKPNQRHGFHIHEYPDCTSKDGKSAGGHYNPQDHKHGSSSINNHAGDLGNIESDRNGNAKIDKTFKNLSLDGRSRTISIAKRSFVLHDGADDLKSSPAGNAGKRVACGVIK